MSLSLPVAYRLRQLAETASTNEDAKKAALAGEAEGLVVQALRQTAGKGRQGRVWDSPEGNLYVSVLLRPQTSSQRIGAYTFVTTLAVYDTVCAFLPEKKVELKWPNDVLVDGKKISGILLEGAPVSEGKIDWLVIGVGINVAFYPEQALYPATSLLAEGSKTNTDPVLERFLNRLEHWRQMLLSEGFTPLREAWLTRAKKGAIRARLDHETIFGDFIGLDEQGRLILRLADGSERRIASGDVFF